MMAVVTGEMKIEELMAFAAAQRVGERRAWALIFDISGAIVNLSSADVQEAAEFSAQSPIGPVAIIASENAVFGLARMFQTYSDISGRDNVGVFRTFDEAQSWLSNEERTQ
jgi:hypothetical protein